MDPNLDWNAYFLLWNPQTGFINRFISFHKLAKKKFCTIADITQVKVNCTWNTYHGDYPPQIKITRLNPFHEELNEIIDFKSVQSIKKWLDWQIHFSQILSILELSHIGDKLVIKPESNEFEYFTLTTITVTKFGYISNWCEKMCADNKAYVAWF